MNVSSNNPEKSGAVLAWLALVSSFGTLICCALPALFVVLGAGAVVAGLVTAVPQIVVLSEHKEIVFAIAGGLLSLAALARYLTRNAPCPIDPAAAAHCAKLRRTGGILLLISGGIFTCGILAAYIAPVLI